MVSKLEYAKSGPFQFLYHRKCKDVKSNFVLWKNNKMDRMDGLQNNKMDKSEPKYCITLHEHVT